MRLHAACAATAEHGAVSLALNGEMHPEYLRQFLRALPGQAYCNDCLHRLLGLPPTDVRAATQRLLGETGFSLKNNTCHYCHEPAVTVMYQAALSTQKTPNPPERKPP
jgi:hypothetical protein